MKNSIIIPFVLCANALFAKDKKLDLQQQEIVSLRQKLNNQQVVISQNKTELEKLSENTKNQKK
jgi:hypothetical protein